MCLKLYQIEKRDRLKSNQSTTEGKETPPYLLIDLKQEMNSGAPNSYGEPCGTIDGDGLKLGKLPIRIAAERTLKRNNEYLGDCHWTGLFLSEKTCFAFG